MRTISFALPIFILLMFSQQMHSRPKSGGARTLSLAQAIELSHENNRSILAASERISEAAGKVDETRSNFMPRLNLSSGYRYLGAVVELPPEIAAMQDRPIGFFTGYSDNYELKAEVQQPIYAGLRNINLYQQASYGMNISEEESRLTKLEVEFQVKTAYYGLLLATEVVKVTKELLWQTQAHHKDVDNHYNAGTASRFELLRSSVQVSNIKPQVIEAENNLELAKINLNNILGLALEADVVPTDSLMYLEDAGSLEDYYSKALANRSEIKIVDLQQNVGETQIGVARSTYKPSVFAFGRYELRTDELQNLFESDNSNWSVGVSVTYDIFDGFLTRSKVSQAESKLRRLNIQKQELIEKVKLEVKQAFLDLEKSNKVIDSQGDNVEQAEEALKIAEASYGSGVITNLEVLDSQLALNQAKLSLLNAIHDYLVSKARLDKASGIEF